MFERSEYYVCVQCTRDKKIAGKFSKENKMDPSKEPNALKDYTSRANTYISGFSSHAYSYEI